MIQYALHHKYQPQQLSKMRGLEKYHPLFRSMIVKKRIFQLLITGDVGTGKSTLAMNLFRSVFCKHLIDFDACMQCDTCLEIGNGCGYGRKLHGSYLTGKEKEHYDQLWTEFAYCGFWAGGPFVWLDDADLMGSQMLDRLIDLLDSFPDVPVVVVAKDAKVLGTPILTRLRALDLHYDASSMCPMIFDVCAKEEIEIAETAAVEVLAQRAGYNPRTILIFLSYIQDMNLMLSLASLEDESVNRNLVKPTGGARFIVHKD